VLRDDGRPVYVERGVITSFAHQTLALGAPTFFWLGRNHIAPPEALKDSAAAVVWSFTRAGALIDSTGRAVGVPMVDTLHPRRTPRLIVQDDRTALVAWTAADSASKTPRASDSRSGVVRRSALE
jgi:hypothetical protein